MKPKILFTTPIIAYPPYNGPTIRIKNSILVLSHISDLYIVSRVRKQSDQEQTGIDIFFSKYSKRLYHINFHYPYFNFYIADKLLKFIYQKFINQEIDQFLSIVERVKPSIVWFGYGNISFHLIKAVRRKYPKIMLVCDTDSIWSEFILREFPYTKNLISKFLIKYKSYLKKREEKIMVDMCNITTAVSSADAQYYKSLTRNRKKVHIFPNVIDIHDFESYKNTKSLSINKPSIFLTGTFWSHSPMEHGTRWFINNVYPLLLSEIPNIQIYIAGTGSDSILSDISIKNIHVLGKIDSTVPYFKSCTLTIVPLFFESGTRYKIIEAGAAKVPVVSTPLGAEGLDVKNNIHLLIANTPEDFSKAISTLIKDCKFRDNLVHNNYELIRKKYCIESIIENMKELVSSL